MAAVFERYPVGGGEFALALALADNAHDDGTRIFPGVDTMAHKSRQDVRTVQRHLRNMQRRGWLILVKAARGRGTKDEYRIDAAWLKGGDLSPIPAVDKSPEKGDNHDKERVTNQAQKGDKSSTPYITVRTNTYPPTPHGGACGFESIAAGYPRRAGIEAARRDWEDLAPDAQLQAEIARAIQAWIPSVEWQREGGRYIPKLGKFLRDKRWVDAPYPATTPAPLPLREPPLTPEQLEANARLAREHIAKARASIGQREAVPA